MLAPQSPVLRRPALILIGGFLLAFLGALGTVFATWSSRDVVLHEWQNRLASVAHMLSAHAGLSLQAADHVLLDVTENITDYGVRNTEEMHHTLSVRPVRDMLHHAIKDLPQIDVISIVARDGTVLNTTLDHALPLNLAGHDDFNAYINDPRLDVFVSQPDQISEAGKWVFYLARKIKSPMGDTLGLILTGLDARFFADFYASIGTEFSNISLLRSDGTILAQHSLGLSKTPYGNMNAAPYTALTKTPKETVLIQPPGSNLRSFEQITSYKSNLTLPIGVSVTSTRQQILKEWENAAIRAVILGGTMSALVIAATMLLFRMIRELETARNAALVASEAKARFASNVSHELRTPMNAIIGGSHQLMQTELPRDSHRFAEIVASAAQQLMILINDILDYSYYEDRHFRIERAPTDTREMIHNTAQMARALVLDKQIDLLFEVANNVPSCVMGDAGRIKQVLLNLLSNAIKFTDQGSVRLRVSFHTGTKNHSDQLIFDIIDTGHGISDEDKRRLFQPFERGLGQIKNAGTGLGLTISKQLVEAMSGTISLKSRKGLGTCVTIALPTSIVSDNQDRTSHASATLNSAPHAKALNILIAEDVAPNRMLLSMFCEKMGHHVVAVENGLLAVEAAQSQAFDLILMDLQMPELDGREATQRIRSGKGPSHAAHILAVSANADLDGPNGLASVGFDDIMLKPVTPARLDFMIAALAVRN